MSETFQELADIPKDFVREGSLFIRRCTKRNVDPPVGDWRDADTLCSRQARVHQD
jgi:hypothetical protein